MRSKANSPNYLRPRNQLRWKSLVRDYYTVVTKKKIGGGAPTQGVVDRLVVVELGSSVVMTTALQTPSKEPDVKMAGTLPRSKMALPQVLTAKVRTKIDRMFIGIPTIPWGKEVTGCM